VLNYVQNIKFNAQLSTLSLEFINSIKTLCTISVFVRHAGPDPASSGFIITTGFRHHTAGMTKCEDYYETLHPEKSISPQRSQRKNEKLRE
jgi:hypothetical protein